MQADATLEFSGTLVHPPEVRTQLLGDNVSVPVVAFELLLDNTAHSILQALRTYQIGGHALALAEAKRWHKGDRITVATSLLDLRLVTRSVCDLRPADSAPTSPASPTQLF